MLVIVKFILAIATINQRQITQLDVNNAFLNGDFSRKYIRTCLWDMASGFSGNKFVALLVYVDDVIITVHRLTQFVSQHRQPHLNAIHHLLQYLKATPGQGLLFLAQSSFQLRAFADADWGSYLDIRKSVTEFCTFFLGNPSLGDVILVKIVTTLLLLGDSTIQ
ncbi:uncharacterized protein LOC111377196, partial [Olea europaea var. sylvestris]|uniref:uncharacterized protein LOC111377196 n=1 Tax=Olea europaea var. sylvestris TaxID=158386 RepID=UPI000C1CE0A2